MYIIACGFVSWLGPIVYVAGPATLTHSSPMNSRYEYMVEINVRLQFLLTFLVKPNKG